MSIIGSIRSKEEARQRSGRTTERPETKKKRKRGRKIRGRGVSRKSEKPKDPKSPGKKSIPSVLIPSFGVFVCHMICLAPTRLHQPLHSITSHEKREERVRVATAVAYLAAALVRR